MKNAIFAVAGAATLAFAGPASADDHTDDALAAVLADELRDEDRARDKYRNPAETLAFFQVEPTQTVVEYGPGGRWYTRVLAPYIMPNGTYIAINGDSDGRNYRNRAQEARSKGWTERFKNDVAGEMDIDPEDVNAFEIDEVPEEMAGTADRVLIFRSMHGLANGNTADDVLDTVRMMLKDDGMVGVVQHRAPKDASFDDYSPAPGYIKYEQVVAIFVANGFELVSASEVNANPKDTADYEGGVWTLPPVLRNGETDREKYLAIGESDRMTLLFKKAD